MIARPHAQRAASPRNARPLNIIQLSVGRRAALQADLAHVADLLPRDPDAAALLLDGLLKRLGVEWFMARHRPAPPSERLLELLEREDAPYAWRLRLALRAP